MKRHLVLLLFAAACSLLAADDAWEAQRQRILDRPREVFYNTDGCDAVYFGLQGHTKAATPENFKAERFAYCLGTETTTLSYCVTGGGFGHVLYDSKVASHFSAQPDDSGGRGRNVLDELLAQGTDPMRLAVEFCREHSLECFACLRMNDTHDGIHSAKKPSIFWSPFKEAHPDALFGSEEHRTPYCTWTAVDFNHPAVHKYYHDVVEELCKLYDIDGFEYDFMRHAQLFRSVANGGRASQAELDTATALMRDLRAVTEAAGHAKGRPVMIAIRVPDSVEYCNAIGIDIERWLSEKLVDILITTSYFQLNPWRYTVDLARKYGVKCLASLDESRIRPPHLPLGSRNSLQSYQAQALAAMRQGVDGIYVFNAEYGALTSRAFAKPETLKFKDKLYYATYRGSGGYLPGGYLRNGEFFSNMPAVEPGNQAAVASDGSLDIPIYIGDDLQDADVMARRPAVTAQLRSPAGCDFRLAVNGTDVPLARKSLSDGVYTYDVPAALIQCGENRFVVSPHGYKGALSRVVAVKGDALLYGGLRGQWRRFYQADEADGERIVDGAYQLKDTVSDAHTAAALWHPLPGKDAARLKVKATITVVAATDDSSAVLRLADGTHVERIAFLPGEIRLVFCGKSVPFDTTDAFHSYEVEFAGGQVTVQADGKALLSAPLAGDVRDEKCSMVGYTESIPGLNARGVVIGSVSGPGQGTMLFKDFEILQDTLVVRDFAVAIHFAEEPEAELLALKDAAIQPLAQVAVRNGGVVLGEGVVNVRYAADGIVQDNEAVLLLHRHRNGGPYFDLAPAMQAQLLEPPRFLLAEFTAAALADGPNGEPAFLFNLAPVRPGKENQTWEFDLRIGTGALFCDSLKGRADCADINLAHDNTYRVAMDTQTGKAVLWCNGKLLLAGTISRGVGRTAPFAYVGDASAGVDGIVRFKGAAVGVPK